MKICFLAHGTSVHTQRWMGYFENRGHELSLVTFTPGTGQGRAPVYPLRPLRPVGYRRANWHYLLRLLELRRRLRAIRPDLICAHFLSSYGLLAALARPRGCPLAICIQGSDLLVFPLKSPLHGAAARFALGKADLVILPAAHMLDSLKAFSEAGRPVLTLQYGIDLGRFHPLGRGAPRGEALCFCNRAMVPGSGVDTILGAAAILKSRGSALSFCLAGGGDRRPLLQKMARDLGLGKTVAFSGPIDPRQMPAALRRASVYISMAASDGASLSLMEAMACGLFPVVADIPANREWVTEGGNGFLVPLGRPEALAARLQEAWEERELRREAADVNWRLVQARCDYFQNMQKIEAALVKLAAA